MNNLDEIDLMSLINIIKNRISSRTFDDKKIDEHTLNKLSDFLKNSTNPFDVSIDFRILDKEVYDLSSPVIVGEKMYVAAKTKKVKNFELAYGYEFERFCLFAESLNIGTAILVATLSRKKFEAAMNLNEHEVCIAASPIGYKAKKFSIRETLLRKALKSEKRFNFNEIFFDKNFDKALDISYNGLFKEALEMLRLSPSAENKQPWRVVVEDTMVHFYKKRNESMIHSKLGDIQKIDVGIAIAHFELVMNRKNINGKFLEINKNIENKKDSFEYVISYCIQS
nr:nitroreductase family protein [uncultured Fusobacterium sp.]